MAETVAPSVADNQLRAPGRRGNAAALRPAGACRVDDGGDRARARRPRPADARPHRRGREACDRPRRVDRVSDPAGLPELRRAIAVKLQRENGVDGRPRRRRRRHDGRPGRPVPARAGDPRAVGRDPRPRPALHVVRRRDPDGRGEDGLGARPRSATASTSIPTRSSSGSRRRTRVLLLITPGNPTAGTITPPNLRRLAEIARKHDLVVISDEIYEKLLYDGAEHLSIGSLPGMAERTITLNGFSKTYCMTGWRVGYLAGPRNVMRRVRRLKELASSCAPVVSQWAGVAALEGPQDAVEEYRRIYEGRRRVLLDGLDRLGFTYGDAARRASTSSSTRPRSAWTRSTCRGSCSRRRAC